LLLPKKEATNGAQTHSWSDSPNIGDRLKKVAFNCSNVIFLCHKKARWCHMVLTARVHVLRMKFQVFADLE
jgi:hypothetical protein